ncbi:hypothetical protein DAEQUDRAFT_558266 [Daedalea quercina L-15889]|uniref:Uncharacterized protein n=1 Tax=Daedalea quercina L-15889 TaxID=1314783 RepID=A0A165M299_9APHY|nr:hypothetical protein DAEQUDRAFT_558266 [Daedalea quercina L-15889]
MLTDALPMLPAQAALPCLSSLNQRSFPDTRRRLDSLPLPSSHQVPPAFARPRDRSLIALSVDLPDRSDPAMPPVREHQPLLSYLIGFFCIFTVSAPHLRSRVSSFAHELNVMGHGRPESVPTSTSRRRVPACDVFSPTSCTLPLFVFRIRLIYEVLEVYTAVYTRRRHHSDRQPPARSCTCTYIDFARHRQSTCVRQPSLC